MKILVRHLNLESSANLSEYAHTRIEVAIGRVAHPTARVTSVISDENGPKGGVDKRCRIRVTQPGSRGEEWNVSASHYDAYAAVDLACDRIARVMTERKRAGLPDQVRRRRTS